MSNVNGNDRADTSNRSLLETLFGQTKPVIAMMHLLPLPGRPLYDSKAGMAGIVDALSATWISYKMAEWMACCFVTREIARTDFILIVRPLPPWQRSLENCARISGFLMALTFSGTRWPPSR